MLKSIITSVFILLIGVFFLTGCPDETTIQVTEDGVIMPLAVGNYWKFIDYYYKSSDVNNIKDLDSSIIIIKEKIILEGEDWFLTENENILYANRSDGLWWISRNNEGEFIRDSAILIFKYPTYIGDKLNNGNPILINKTVAADVPITVPAGSFNCINYQFDADRIFIRRNSFYAPNVGMIKAVNIEAIYYNVTPPDTTISVIELLEYNIMN